MVTAARVERVALTDVTVIIPIFGDMDVWAPMAARAFKSVLAQTCRPKVVVSGGDTLQEARNRSGLTATTEWLCFLDADDELDPNYIHHMLLGDGDIRQPSTLGIVEGVEDGEPVLIPPRRLTESNYVVIGAFVRTEIFCRVGGFDDFAAFEDWDLWRRCVGAGAVIGAAPEAIYRVHVRSDSRNSMSTPGAVEAYKAIRQRAM